MAMKGIWAIIEIFPYAQDTGWMAKACTPRYGFADVVCEGLEEGRNKVADGHSSRRRILAVYWKVAEAEFFSQSQRAGPSHIYGARAFSKPVERIFIKNTSD